MQRYDNDFPPLQDVNRAKKEVHTTKNTSKKFATSPCSAKKTKVSKEANSNSKEIVLSQDPIPPVYVSSAILSSSAGSSPRSGIGYTVNEDIFYEDINETDKPYIEFEVYERPEVPLSKMADEYDMYCSDSDADCDGEDTPLQISYQPVPNGCIINSTVYLSVHQWNTLVTINDSTMLCAVCDLYTDCDTCDQHLVTSAHEANLTNCKVLYKADMSVTRKIRTIFHCGVCNEVFGPSDREIHYDTKKHEGNLLFAINKATDILYSSSNAYSYENKENAQGYDNKMAAKNEEKDCYHFNANKSMDSPRNTYTDYGYEDDDNLKFINYQNNFDYADEFEYEEPEVPIAGISYAKMAKTPKVEVQKFIEVDLGDKKVKVRFDSYHMIIISKKMKNEFWCMVCKIYEHLKNKFIHCQNTEHMSKLITFRVVEQYNEYFIRQVDAKLYHCGHCNNLQMAHDMEDHVETVHPRRTRQNSETKHAVKPSPVKVDNKLVKGNSVKRKELFKNVTAIKTGVNNDVAVRNNTNVNKTNDSKKLDGNFKMPIAKQAGVHNDNFKMPLTPVEAANFPPLNNKTDVKPYVPNPYAKNLMHPANPLIKKLTGPNVFKITHTPPNFNQKPVDTVKSAMQTIQNNKHNVIKDVTKNEGAAANVNKSGNNANDMTCQSGFMTNRDVPKIELPAHVNSQSGNNMTNASQNSNVMINRDAAKIDMAANIKSQNENYMTGQNSVMKTKDTRNDFDNKNRDINMTNASQNSNVMINRNAEIAATIKSQNDSYMTSQNSVMTKDAGNYFDNNTREVSKFDTKKELELTTKNIAQNNVQKNMQYFEVTDENIVLYPFGCKMMVPLLSYNVVLKQPRDFYCGLCDILFTWNYIKPHLCDVKHVEILQRTPFVQPFKYHLIRAIRDAFHCTICNCPIAADKILQHPNEAIHTAKLMKCLKYKPQDVTCELGFTGARETQGSKSGYSMSNEEPNKALSNDITRNMTPNPRPIVNTQMLPQENMHKLPEYSIHDKTGQSLLANRQYIARKLADQTSNINTAQNIINKPTQVNKVAQRINDMAQEISINDAKKTDLTANANNSVFGNGDSSNNLRMVNFEAPNKVQTDHFNVPTNNNSEPTKVYDTTSNENKIHVTESNPYVTASKPYVTNSNHYVTAMRNVFEASKNASKAANNTSNVINMPANAKPMYYSNDSLTNPPKPSTWSYTTDSELIPEKLTRPVNPTVIQSAPTEIESTPKSSPVKSKFTHEMAKIARYELQKARMAKTNDEANKISDIITAKGIPNAQTSNNNTTFHNPNIKVDQEKTPKEKIADFIAKHIPASKTKINVQEANTKIENNTVNNSSVDIPTNNTTNKFNANKPQIAAKEAPDVLKQMLFVLPDLTKPPPNVIKFSVKDGIATPILPYTKPDTNQLVVETNQPVVETYQPVVETYQPEVDTCQPEVETYQVVDKEENIDIPDDVNDESEEESEENYESLDESMDKTFESQGSDEVNFDNEEYVYLNLKNTFIKISNTAYNTLVHIGDGSRYCFVCSEQMDYIDLQKHVDSRSHIEKVQAYRFLDKYEGHLLRQNFLNYHCAICNVIVTRKDLKSHIEWSLHTSQNAQTFKNLRTLKEMKGGVKNVTVSTTKEIIYLNEHEPPIKIFLNVNVTFRKKTDSDYYENIGNGKVTKVESLNKSDVLRNMPKKEPGIAKPMRLKKLIFIDGKVLKVSWENWHGVSLIKTGYKCNLCQRDLLETDLDAHCASDWHCYSLKKDIERAWVPALIRKINDTALNCIICNTELPNKSHLVKEHVNGKKHIRNYDVLKCESEKGDTYQDCDEDVFNIE